MEYEDDKARHERLIDLVLAAQGLLYEWWGGGDMERYFSDPNAEEMIVEAAVEITNPDDEARWLFQVRGDGGQPRRVRLAQRCAEAIYKRNESLRWPPE